MALRNVGDLVRDRAALRVGPGETVRAATRAMTERRVGAVAVVEGEALVGMFTERDLMCRVVADGRDPDRTSVGEVMTTELETIAPDGAIVDALERMVEGHFRHMPVVEGDRLVGLIAMRDIPLEHRVMRENWHKARHALDQVRSRPH
jgi:CBS domain-containing protein